MFNKVFIYFYLFILFNFLTKWECSYLQGILYMQAVIVIVILARGYSFYVDLSYFISTFRLDLKKKYGNTKRWGAYSQLVPVWLFNMELLPMISLCTQGNIHFHAILLRSFVWSGKVYKFNKFTCLTCGCDVFLISFRSIWLYTWL